MTADIVQLNPDLAPELGSDERALIVDVEGFEGPLDLLLTLARQQKLPYQDMLLTVLTDEVTRRDGNGVRFRCCGALAPSRVSFPRTDHARSVAADGGKATPRQWLREPVRD